MRDGPRPDYYVVIHKDNGLLSRSREEDRLIGATKGLCVFT